MHVIVMAIEITPSDETAMPVNSVELSKPNSHAMPRHTLQSFYELAADEHLCQPFCRLLKYHQLKSAPGIREMATAD